MLFYGSHRQNFEDTDGKLWIATCLGGIFVVDKQKLVQSSGGTYIAEQNYSTRNGLSGMFINQIVPDAEGNVWVLLYNSKGIDKINPRTQQVTKLFADELSGEKSPNYLLRDTGNKPSWCCLFLCCLRCCSVQIGESCSRNG